MHPFSNCVHLCRYGPLTRRVFEKVIKQRMEREEAEESGMGEEELEDEGAEAL